MIRVLIFFLFFLNTHFTFLFQFKSVVLLKGVARDYRAQTPLELEFFLISDSNRVSVKTSGDGSFHIPLNSSGVYQIFSKKHFIREPRKLEINIQNSYSEEEVVLFFEPIEVGFTLCNIVGFEKGTEQLTQEAMSFLEFIGKQNKITPGIFYRVEINTTDVLFKDIIQKEKIGNKIKKIKISAQEQANALNNRRIQKIKEFLASIGFPARNVQYIAQSNVSSEIFSKKSSTGKKMKQVYSEKIDSNFKIIVEKTMDIK
ncbi:MAG: hypothetical protein ACUVQ1_06660 [Candidatus Kapaibacteriales bacterium]